ncbi:oxidoreductase family, NAD-binding rossmann fold protein [Ceratobasidium sp. AG-Ba]|nr:oxidoreductase family, NAD-binding rossmann fold protein [Ceratobasidium sp. AG-Ba]
MSLFNLKWGILGAGHISGVFVRVSLHTSSPVTRVITDIEQDILLDPKTRDVTDVLHHVAAVGSRDVAKAQEFIDKNAPSRPDIKAYGSYEEVVTDKNVDAVYIGTPHTHHYTCTALALRAKKHVLCEKPFTSNAAELKSLIEIAKENNVFLMEAMWTRFLPVAKAIKSLVDSGELGDVKVLHADLAGDFKLDSIPKTHRILDPKLGGGALLDLGPYPFVWAAIALYEHPQNNREAPSSVTGSMLKTKLTGVDSSTTFVLNFDKIEAQAILSCSITISTPNPALVIRCGKGNIVVAPPIYKPSGFVVQYFDEPGSSKIVKEEKTELAFHGGGWHFQADEVARCIRDGKLQSDVWSLEESLVQMSVFDEVRKQCGYEFPPGVEQVV